MPTAPTGMDPSKLRPELGDEEAAPRRAPQRTTRDSPPKGPEGELAAAGLPKIGTKKPEDRSSDATALPDQRPASG